MLSVHWAVWQDRISAATWQMRSTFASSTRNQADPNRTIILQIWCQNSKVGLSRAWLSLSLVVVIQSFFNSHISSLPDMCSWWRMLLTSSGTPTQIISVISNDMWYRTAEYWQETEGDLFVRSGSLVLRHLSFFSRVCGRYSPELSLKHLWWMYTSQPHRWRWYLEPAAPSRDYRA